MGIRCPICSCNIETDETVIQCPACREKIDHLIPKEGESGMTTATATGPGLKPLTDSIEDVY